MTVHKSQGATLSRAELMVSNAFDYGQAYVALSRVTNLEGLWLTQPLTKQSVLVHPAVLKFYGYTDNSNKAK
jgi:ATP-dependent DNA helicase PIF1